MTAKKRRKAKKKPKPKKVWAVLNNVGEVVEIHMRMIDAKLAVLLAGTTVPFSYASGTFTVFVPKKRRKTK